MCIEAADYGPNNMTVSYNRFYGNKATVAGTYAAATGLAVGCAAGGRTFSAVIEDDNWWGCNGLATGTGCDTAHDSGTTAPSDYLTTYTALVLNLSTTTLNQGTAIIATTSLGQPSSGSIYTAAQDTAYLATPIHTFTITGTGTVTYNPSATAFSSSAATATSYAAATATGTTNTTGTGTATLTVDGTTLTKTYTIALAPPSLSAASAHPGNFKSADTADTYTLTVANATNTSATTGTITLVETLPAGFTATAMTGTGWSCTVSSLTCTTASSVASGASFNPVTLTVSVSSTDIGSYTNSVNVSGGEILLPTQGARTPPSWSVRPPSSRPSTPQQSPPAPTPTSPLPSAIPPRMSSPSAASASTTPCP